MFEMTDSNNMSIVMKACCNAMAGTVIASKQETK